MGFQLLEETQRGRVWGCLFSSNKVSFNNVLNPGSFLKSGDEDGIHMFIKVLDLTCGTGSSFNPCSLAFSVCCVVLRTGKEPIEIGEADLYWTCFVLGFRGLQVLILGILAPVWCVGDGVRDCKRAIEKTEALWSTRAHVLALFLVPGKRHGVWSVNDKEVTVCTIYI
ncbi:hypothetical protein NDU88_004935 [Pleurodeles waltl]|uniref:Uncharacterized protein n=1 Tax=Pleurodeles waltl TaxID=8319 RepID=A0AAV7SK85_PLEWA|nr:hypothetical protein NDU88_004935 [Pleurodeles waltl]